MRDHRVDTRRCIGHEEVVEPQFGGAKFARAPEVPVPPLQTGDDNQAAGAQLSDAVSRDRIRTRVRCHLNSQLPRRTDGREERTGDRWRLGRESERLG
jgi:hypothetical protein